jgi:Zn-dependent protease with chaperone function
MRRPIAAAVIVGVLSLGAWPAAQGSGQGSGPLKAEKISGYAEWRRGDQLIVDGQRVAAAAATKFKGKGVTSLSGIPLGYEVEAKGYRLPDGVLLASEIEAKPNGSGMFEGDIRSATAEMEAQWLKAGAVFEEDDEGAEKIIGRIVTRGAHVDRVQRIVKRVTPPYIDPASLRVHVVDTKDWNAMAMGNGAIWVFTGLLDSLDDDEVAVVIGHELAHYTHEHSRREFKRAFWGQLIAIGAMLTTEAATDSDKKTTAVAVAALVGALVVRNGYSRNLEDQADRVGLRYAYEGGYRVAKGPALWMKFRDKYGDQNGLMNFFLGEHSTATARVKNLERELALNYRAVAR